MADGEATSDQVTADGTGGTTASDVSILTVGAIASAGAAIVHATAAGIHAEHVGLTRLFAALALAQGGAAVLGFVRRDRVACVSLFVVNAFAALGWLITRLVGVSVIEGLETAESPQPADTIAAVLALIAVLSAVSCASGRSTRVPGRSVAISAVIVGVLLVPGLADATSHDHASHAHGEAGHADHDDATSHDEAHTDHAADATADHSHDGEAVAGEGAAAPAGHGDDHADGHVTDEAHTDDHAGNAHADDHTDEANGVSSGDELAWPQPWDPTGPIDFSGVPGVSPQQQARAEQLVADTLRELPAFADVDSLEALGYRSIGDASTGHEHYINNALIGDDKFLDPTAPESLVFAVDGDERTLVSAMFIAKETPIDDQALTEYAGPLMQWHVHDNLCWGLNDEGVPVVVGVLENFGGTCPEGTLHAGGENPMVHVWIAPHECGPFAALEGHGAGQASVSEGARMDMCRHGHGDHGGTEHAETVPFDPALPIDLGGTPGVTPQQQAFAENLVAATVRDLPKWADLDAVDAAGFHSIGDAGTGHEHYIQWNWIDDDVWLDPDFPESLVFEPQPDGSKKLVSAMFMLPGGTPLADVPDWGGDLMQWHVHGDLCFTDDPIAPQVAGVKPVDVPCTPPLTSGSLSPMIHVWIEPNECGPFAALEGIAGGQVPDGEAILCDHAHGSH
jgi:hypothetical protein